MKTLIACSAAAVLVITSGCATGKNNAGSAAQSQSRSDTPKTEYVQMTGSYLKQPVTRTGLITDSSSQVMIIDRGAIERSGASDVRQVLNRYGYPTRR